MYFAVPLRGISRYRFHARARISGEVAKHVGITIAVQLLGNYITFRRYQYTVVTFAQRLLTA